MHACILLSEESILFAQHNHVWMVSQIGHAPSETRNRPIHPWVGSVIFSTTTCNVSQCVGLSKTIIYEYFHMF